MNDCISDGIARLLRSELDQAAAGWGTNPAMPSDYGFVRVASLSVERSEEISFPFLHSAVALLLRGMAGVGSPWCYSLVGKPGWIELYWGVRGNQGALITEFRNRFVAVFPGAEISNQLKSGTEFSEDLGALPYTARFSGNPRSVDETRPFDSALNDSSVGYRKGIETLVRTMEGRSWAWLVCAQPTGDASIESSLYAFRRELQELRSAYLRQGTVEAENHPQASAYEALLEKAIENFERGRGEGMWKTSAHLFSDLPSTLERGAMALRGIFSHSMAGPEPVRIIPCSSPAGRRGHLAEESSYLTSSEAASLVTPPAESFAGFEILRVERFRPTPQRPTTEPKIAIGTIQDRSNATPHWYEVTLSSLAGHALIGGITGSGKSTTVKFLLRQIWQEHEVPWLVIEPSLKCEYREMLQTEFGNDLRVYTAGNEPIAPLRINPLAVPEGISVQQHIDSLCSLFSAAFSWVTPMPYVLSASMHRLYEDFGWDLVNGVHPGGVESKHQPTLADLIPVVERVAKECGYDGEVTANVTAGIRTRLRSLTQGAKGHLFNSRSGHRMEDLLSHPTVIELSALGDDEEKAFLMGVLSLKIAQHWQALGGSDGKLRHVLVLEEAHRLLSGGSSTSGAFEAAEARSKAIDLFCNLMAEIRLFGQGLFVVDQIPGKLASEVIRNTNLKIGHRLPAADDRIAVGQAMALRDGQIDELARLSTGEVVVHASGPEEAGRVKVPRGVPTDSPAAPVSSEAVREHMTLWNIPYDNGETGHPNDPPEMKPVPIVDLPQCLGCENDSCGYRRTALKALALRDNRNAFKAAVDGGWKPLWQFGMRVAAEGIEERSAPEILSKLAFCILMNLASLAGWDADTASRLKRNLQVLMSRELSPPNE